MDFLRFLLLLSFSLDLSYCIPLYLLNLGFIFHLPVYALHHMAITCGTNYIFLFGCFALEMFPSWQKRTLPRTSSPFRYTLLEEGGDKLLSLFFWFRHFEWRFGWIHGLLRAPREWLVSGRLWCFPDSPWVLYVPPRWCSSEFVRAVQLRSTGLGGSWPGAEVAIWLFLF